MIPRGSLSISYKQIFHTIFHSFSSKTSGNVMPNERYGKALFCLSARTGLDLSLLALNLAPASEILVTNVNIPDMFTILREHSLTIKPIPLGKDTLDLSIEAITQAITPRTKAILVTHLFGAISNIDDVIALAKRNNLLIIEDCAQVFNFDYIGHKESDVVLFSFGLIKTNTCLTGAMVRFSNETIYKEVDKLNELLPQQKIHPYRSKLLKALIIKIITTKFAYTLIYYFSKWTGKDFDDLLAGFTKGFPGKDVMQKIRFRPCRSNLELLKQKTDKLEREIINKRKHLAEAILTRIPIKNQVGWLNQNHSHWVLPIFVNNPLKLIKALREKGIDASSRASSLVHLETDENYHKNQLQLDYLVYLPIDKALLQIAWRNLL